MTKKTEKSPDPVSIKVRLTRITSTNQNLRTPTIEGMTSAMPRVGHSFRMFGDSLTPGASFRLIQTSRVVVAGVAVVSGEMNFETENSKYKLEIL